MLDDKSSRSLRGGGREFGVRMPASEHAYAQQRMNKELVEVTLQDIENIQVGVIFPIDSYR